MTGAMDATVQARPAWRHWSCKDTLSLHATWDSGSTSIIHHLRTKNAAMWDAWQQNIACMP